MTDAELADMRKLCEAATPGPWHVRPMTKHCGVGVVARDRAGIDEVLVGCEFEPGDAAFVANARTTLPQLLDDLVAAMASLSISNGILLNAERRALHEWNACQEVISERDAALLAARESAEELAELRAAITERFGIALIRTDQDGIHSGRRRWLVKCSRCGEQLHEATTGPFAWHDRHECRATKGATR